jgi:hypothetical protein
MLLIQTLLHQLKSDSRVVLINYGRRISAELSRAITDREPQEPRRKPPLLFLRLTVLVAANEPTIQFSHVEILFICVPALSIHD